MNDLSSVQNLEAEAKGDLARIQTPQDAEAFRVTYLGKKGKISGLMERIKELSADEKKAYGKAVNDFKRFIESSLGELKIKDGPALEPSPSSAYDPTLASLRPRKGSLHPITQAILEISKIFVRLGFEIIQGPEIETEYHNFTALNIPLNHPSRDAFDTFYVDGGRLLRSQTSTVQIRVMQTRKPPLRVIAPGRVYRPDAVDASHSFMFHQIEGLMVDDKATFSDLKGVLKLFLHELFGSAIAIRFRPHYFPFTEPSVEVDIQWEKGWLEILGAGSVHPNVFKAVGYSPKKVKGFAFGLGVERMAMIRHGIPDIRLFYENDLRFLEQFS